jgi:hypothetical protein
VNKGYLMKMEAKVKVKNVRSHWRERDQFPAGIVENQVAWELISQGIPTIQTTISLRGYVSSSRELWGEKQVTRNR